MQEQNKWIFDCFPKIASVKISLYALGNISDLIFSQIKKRKKERSIDPFLSIKRYICQILKLCQRITHHAIFCSIDSLFSFSSKKHSQNELKSYVCGITVCYSHVRIHRTILKDTSKKTNKAGQ